MVDGGAGGGGKARGGGVWSDAAVRAIAMAAVVEAEVSLQKDSENDYY